MKRILKAVLQACWEKRSSSAWAWKAPWLWGFLSDGFSLECTERKAKSWDKPKKGEKVCASMLCFYTDISKAVPCRSVLCRFKLSQRIICPRGFIIRHSWGRNLTQDFFRQHLDKFIRGTDCFTIFGSQQNCERDSPGFLCRKWEGGEEEGAVKCSLVLYTVSLMYFKLEHLHASAGEHRPAVTWKTC